MSVPRRLVLLRHAAAASSVGLDDAERPLTDAGERDASAVGRWLRASGIFPDLVLCSSARRASQTWHSAAAELRRPPPVTHDQRIYRADEPTLLDIVRETDDNVCTLLLVGHNPPIHQLAADLTGAEEVRGRFPAAAVAVVSVAASWAVLAADSADLAAFEPRPQ